MKHLYLEIFRLVLVALWKLFFYRILDDWIPSGEYDSRKSRRPKLSIGLRNYDLAITTSRTWQSSVWPELAILKVPRTAVATFWKIG